jgi:hypothetical protein
LYCLPASSASIERSYLFLEILLLKRGIGYPLRKLKSCAEFFKIRKLFKMHKNTLI